MLRKICDIIVHRVRHFATIVDLIEAVKEFLETLPLFLYDFIHAGIRDVTNALVSQDRKDCDTEELDNGNQNHVWFL